MYRKQHKKVATSGEQAADRRSLDRYKLVLRIGLLEQDGRSIFCLVKNISSAGVQIKPYGQITQGTSVALQVGDENPIPGTVVWSRDRLAGIRFGQPLNPQALLRIGQKLAAHRRRAAPRAVKELDGWLRTGGKRYSARLCDVSMSGARVRTVQPVTFGETTLIEMPGLPSLKAYVRWSDGAEYGLSFHASVPIQILADLLAQEHISERPGQF